MTRVEVLCNAFWGEWGLVIHYDCLQRKRYGALHKGDGFFQKLPYVILVETVVTHK